MYRAVALAALRRGLTERDSEPIARLANELTIEFDGTHTLLNGEDVSKSIRASEVAAAVYLAADNVDVRRQLVELQRKVAAGRDIVTEGRDQGTVAFPSAECKIFLTASRHERARRRYEELIGRGEPAHFDEVLKQLDERDRRDAARPVGALVKAPDAVEVFTDHMTLEEVVDRLEEIVRQKGGNSEFRIQNSE
jgi:cytidylate kinase